MEIEQAIERAYEQLDGEGDAHKFHLRHKTPSLNVLTIKNPTEAAEACDNWRDEIAGKRVVEVGAGTGFLSLEMARHAEIVIAIESDPAWSWMFIRYLYHSKPANLTWIFGTAESVAGFVRADVAVIRTYSGLRQMIAVAEQMAPRVVLDFAQGWQVANRGDPILTTIANGVDDAVPGKIAEEMKLRGL